MPQAGCKTFWRINARRTFGGLPELLQLLGRGRGDSATFGFKRLFHVAKATGEAVGGFAQGILGVQSQLARQIGQGKQGVAQLVHHLVAIARLAGVIQLGQFLVDLVAHASDVRPVEAHRACLLAGARGAHQGRCAARNSVERALAPLLRFLDRLELGPVGQHGRRGLGLRFAEHMRVSAHQLGHDPAHDIVDPEGTLGVA